MLAVHVKQAGDCFVCVCVQYWRQVYLVTVLAMMLAVFFAQIHPHYLTKKWQQLRSVIFCAVAGYGLIPTVHWIWLSGGFGTDVVQVRFYCSQYSVTVAQLSTVMRRTWV